jgi:hypothetical protein
MNDESIGELLGRLCAIVDECALRWSEEFFMPWFAEIRIGERALTIGGYSPGEVLLDALQQAPYMREDADDVIGIDGERISREDAIIVAGLIGLDEEHRAQKLAALRAEVARLLAEGRQQ